MGSQDPGAMGSVHDPRVLRAIAHPIRNQVLGELYAAGHGRAADLAERLDIPANQASFHLRQLAKYGLVEPAPEHARDGRDRVWKPVHEKGLNLRLEEMEHGPGGEAAVAVWRRQASHSAHAAVDRAYAHHQGAGAFIMLREDWLRLTPEEAKQYAAELDALLARWVQRGQTGDQPGRRTYHQLQVLQPQIPPDAD